jgi:hypothetical protein
MELMENEYTSDSFPIGKCSGVFSSATPLRLRKIRNSLELVQLFLREFVKRVRFPSG